MYLLENPKLTFHFLMLSVLSLAVVQSYRPAQINHTAQKIGHTIDFSNDIIYDANQKTLEEMRKRMESNSDYQILYNSAIYLQEELEMVDLLLDNMQTEFRSRMSKKPTQMGLTRQFFIDEGNAKKLENHLNFAYKILESNIKNLQQKIKDSRQRYWNITDGAIDSFLWAIPLEFNNLDIDFEQLTPELADATLSKLRNDIEASKTVGINFLADKIGKCCMCFEKFSMFSNSPKPYIALGEQFEADIAIGQFTSQAKFSVSIDGQPFPVKNSKATFSQKPTTLGEHSYHVKIFAFNPITERDTFLEKTFYYEVGLPNIALESKNSKILYRGIENTLTLSNPNFELEVPTGVALRQISNTQFAIVPNKKGALDIQIKNPKTNQKYTFSFKVENAPMPNVCLLANTKTGLISAAQMQQQRELQLDFQDTDFSNSCQVESFTLTYIPKREDAQLYENKSAKFNTTVQNALKSAKTGDQYAFTNVQVRCAGEQKSRELNSLAFVIQ